MENQNVSHEDVYDDMSLALSIQQPKMAKYSKVTQQLNLNFNLEKSSQICTQPQDADYKAPPSSEELENLIIARLPRSHLLKYCHINKRWLSLIKTGEVYKIRRATGFMEPSAFMLAGGDETWWEFYRPLNAWRRLPLLPADCMRFILRDKYTLCVGTQLLVLEREFDNIEMWIYDLVMDKWCKGPNMLTVRCLFGSATCGNFAYIAGGIDSNNNVLNNAEKYNPETKSWQCIPPMKRCRKLCSGFYMDEKFYVIGGRGEIENNLPCGEAFDQTSHTWELIPNMLRDIYIYAPMSTTHSPPLVAVVNNELYLIDTFSNELKVYLKNIASWRSLGPVPVRADLERGCVAFKALGNELIVIGAVSSGQLSYQKNSVFICCPDPHATESIVWKPLDGQSGYRIGDNFIKNCAVMLT